METCSLSSQLQKNPLSFQVRINKQGEKQGHIIKGIIIDKGKK